MLAGRQVLCSGGLGSLQQPAAGRAHFGVQRQRELRKRRCASCRAQYDAGWASSSLDAQVMLRNLRLAADCGVDGEAENGHSCPVQTLSKRAALLQYAETVEPSLIETFSEQVCAYRIASPTAGAFPHGTCVSCANLALSLALGCGCRYSVTTVVNVYTAGPCNGFGRLSHNRSRRPGHPTATVFRCPDQLPCRQLQGAAVQVQAILLADTHVRLHATGKPLTTKHIVHRPKACFARASHLRAGYMFRNALFRMELRGALILPALPLGMR
jgi:hypothetical protein